MPGSWALTCWEGRPAAGMRVDAGQGREWWLPNASSLSRGRAKLGPGVHRYLFTQVAGPIGADDAPGVSCCGLRIVSVDGSATDVPDEKANDEFFGRPSNQSRDGAFPQVRWVVAAESGTGSLLGAAVGAYRTAEQPLARDLLEQGCFGPGMLVLADRKFLSWSLVGCQKSAYPVICGDGRPAVRHHDHLCPCACSTSSSSESAAG